MKWKDTQDPQILNEKPEEEYFNEEQFTAFGEKRKAGAGNALSERKQAPSILKITIGLVVAVVVLILFLIPGLFSNTEEDKVLALERRIKKLEQRFDEFTAVDEKVTRIWEEAKSFEKFKDRFDRSEASMSLRMDHLAMSLDAIQKNLAQAQTVKKTETQEVAPQKPVTTSAQQKPSAKPEVEKSSPRYHVVNKGETLYRIGLKYNMKAEDLIRLNNLPANPVIKPGQKLLISK